MLRFLPNFDLGGVAKKQILVSRLLFLLTLVLIGSPSLAENLKGVLLNPNTGYVAPIIVVEGGQIEAHHLSACGPGCKFTDFMRPGQCMVVSVSLADGTYGHHFGPADDISNSRAQARRHCQRFGGSRCVDYQPICN